MIKGFIKRAQAKQRAKEAGEATEEEEEAPQEAEAAEGEGGEAAEGEGGEAEGEGGEEEEGAAEGEEGAKAKGGPGDGRPCTTEWEGHPYDYPWTDEERKTTWFTEEELPRELFDLIAFPPLPEEGIEIKHRNDMPWNEETGKVDPPPKSLTKPAHRAAWTRTVQALQNEELEEIICDIVEEYHRSNPQYSALSQATKDQIYELHKLDPENWNLTALSLKFGLSRARVKALLMFGKMQEVAAAHGELFPDHSAEIEENFGAQDRVDDKIKLELRERHYGDVEDESIDRSKLKERLKKHLPRMPPKSEVPLETPPNLVELRESKILFEPPPNMPNRAKGMIVMDMDDDRPILGPSRQKKDPRTRLIWIHEPTGLIRTPTRMERYWIWRSRAPVSAPKGAFPVSQQPHNIKHNYLKHYGESREFYSNN